MFFAEKYKLSAVDFRENVQKKSLQDTFINDVMHPWRGGFVTIYTPLDLTEEEFMMYKN